MSRFFERYFEKEKIDKVACAPGGENKRGSRLIEKREKTTTLRPHAQSILSTKSNAANYSLKTSKLKNLSSKHRFPACLSCLSYSWRAEESFMRPWCEKIDTGVFELRACPKGLWKKSKPLLLDD